MTRQSPKRGSAAERRAGLDKGLGIDGLEQAGTFQIGRL